MVVRFLLETNDLSVLKFYFHLIMLDMNWKEYTSIATIQCQNAIMTSAKISSRTLFYQEVQPCLKVWENVCGKSSTNWLHQQIKSKSLLHQSVNTLSGLVVLSFPHFQPSRQCGSTNRSMMSQVLLLFIASVSERQRCSCSLFRTRL